MKRFFLILLSIVIVIGALASVAYAGYRIGFSQGVRTSSNDDTSPSVGRPNFDSERGPFAFDRDFDRRFERSFPHSEFEMIRRRGGFGGLGLFRFFIPLTILGLLGLIAYLLFTRSGWRLIRTEQTVQQTSPNVQTVATVEKQETKNE